MNFFFRTDLVVLTAINFHPVRPIFRKPKIHFFRFLAVPYINFRQIQLFAFQISPLCFFLGQFKTDFLGDMQINNQVFPGNFVDFVFQFIDPIDKLFALRRRQSGSLMSHTRGGIAVGNNQAAFA